MRVTLDAVMPRIETPTDMLFSSLADQVKLPLTQIRNMAEGLNAADIDTTALAALRLIDGYILAVQLQQENAIQLEPVSVSSLFYDTADKLRDYAKLHNCDIELAIGGRYEPVMAQRKALESALVSLGYSFIGASGQSTGGRQTVRLSLQKRSGRITAGVYSSSDGLSTGLLKQARRLAGKAHQALPGFSSESGAGVLIADRLLAQMDSIMRPSRSGHLNGLAASLAASRQLSLV